MDPSATFMIAIEAKETQGAKMTMANAVLERCVFILPSSFRSRPFFADLLSVEQPRRYDLRPRATRRILVEAVVEQK